MEEARKRNPHIILEGLQWGAPGWIGNGNFFSEDNARFIAAFHKGAKQYHNLDIEYQGIWNEKPCDPEWIKVLRKTLDQSGLQSVKIVADDRVAARDAMENRRADGQGPGPCAAVHTLNAHCAESPNFQVPSFAGNLKKPLWNGEMHAYGGDWYAAAGHARFNNRAYIQGRITSTVSWSLISSYHDYLTCPKSGPMAANTPWSGRYEVQPPLWMIAHTNQFAEPGWKYLDGACRFFTNEACLREGWSIVALRSPDSGDYSIIIETMDAKVPQNVRFRISKDLSQGDLAVWRSVFQGDLFARQADVPVRDGQFTMTLVPNAVYSLTTTRGQRKGEPAHAMPAAKPFPLPFTADFEDQVVGGPGRYFSDQHGTFEVARRSDGKGKCLRQTVTRQGIQWVKYPNPRTIVGDPQWKDYALAVDVMLPHGGKAMVWGRVGRLDNVWDAASVPFSGYGLEIADDGSWSLGIEKRVLASGKTAPLGTDWHTVTMSFAGETVTAGINGRQLAEVKDGVPACGSRPSGLVGLGSGWNEACFANLRVSTLLPPNFGDTSGWGRNIQRTMRLLATSTPQKRNTVRVLFYGQSITEQRWCQAVADDLRARFPYANLVIENRALGGFGSQMLVKTSETDLYPFYPDLVIFRDQGRTTSTRTLSAACASGRWPRCFCKTTT